MYNMQQSRTAFLCNFAMCFRVVYKIKQRTELQFVPFRALLFLFRAIPHNSKCRYGERGAADAKPKAQIILDCLIEHFGNADAVPQLPERCLSRKAGIVRCCLG